MKRYILSALCSILFIGTAYGSTSVSILNNCHTQGITLYSFGCFDGAGPKTANNGQTAVFSDLHESCTYTIFGREVSTFSPPKTQTGQDGSNSNVVLQQQQDNVCVCQSGCSN